MRIARLLIIPLVLLLAPSIFAADKDQAFTTDKRDFKKRFATIALSPVDADPLFNMPDSVAKIVEEEITKRLQRRGYNVLPSSVLAGIRSTMEAQVGGTTNAETGETDAARLQAVRSHALRELWLQHQFDGVATIRISTTTAQFAKSKAEWDGVTQKVESEGRDKGYGGGIVASSISFAVFDEAMRVQYVYYGGLELLQMRVEAQLLPVPADQYFLDEKRIRKAAQIAVSPI